MKINDIKKYLDLYDQETYLFDIVGSHIRKKGFMEFEEFYMICMWKSARQKQNYLKNREIIEAVTREAFTEEDELSKMDMLCKLNGVGIPTASAILTIVFPDLYAVIDIRCIEMLQKLGVTIKESITIKNWIYYLGIIRTWAKENNVTPREIDKVLFAMHRETLEKNGYRNLYSKENKSETGSATFYN